MITMIINALFSFTLFITSGHVIRISVRRLGLDFPSLNHRITDE